MGCLVVAAPARGQATLFTFDGDSAFDQFGFSVSGAGDVNADGFADLIVGAYRDDNNGSTSGSARVFSGLDGSVLYTFNGDSAGDQFGFSVSGAGDVNADGFADLIVGATVDDNNGPFSGSARVFSGLDGSILFTVNGDGFADLIVGAVGDNNAAGSARVISPVVDPSILVINLIAAVVDLNLQQGIHNRLVRILDAALRVLQDANDNNDQAAINVLQAFINAVQAQSGNHIPEADADALIAAAQAIIALLSSS
ncbi:MAG: FG-GAP repeat protein [Planctomycetes bacterium]|nr:FG-GAP repeat protein [Planctomycetota bacterium]